MANKESKPVRVSTYDWTITLKKFLTGWLITITPVTLLYAINFLETETFPTEFAIYIPLIVAILHAFMNYFKHFTDGKYIDPVTGNEVTIN